MGQPKRREDGCHVPRLLSSVHELHIRKPQPWERMGPALSRRLKQNGREDGEGEIGQCPGVELLACSPDWKIGRGRQERPQGHANMMRGLENISDKGAEEEEPVGL